MKTSTFAMTVVFLLILGLVLPQGAAAEAVGRLSQVEGRVDLLKGGQLPATPVKVGDEVGKGDVLRTKSLSKAQITFVDNSVLTISPESRVAIEEYMFDAAKGKRNAVLEVFYGMVLTAVSKIYQTEQPDFKVKTHTAIMGIRGTEVGIRLGPNSSEFLNFKGLTRVSSNFPEVKGHVDLANNEGTIVFAGLPPTLKFDVSEEYQKSFKKGFDIVASVNPKGSVCSSAAPTCAAPASGSDSGNAAAGLGPGSNQGLSGISVVPAVFQPKFVEVASTTYNITEVFTFPAGGISYTNTGGVFTSTSPYVGTIKEAGNVIGTFKLSDFTINVIPTTGQISGVGSGGASQFKVLSASATLAGPTGGLLTGTMQMTATTQDSKVPNFNLSGPVTLTPTNGSLFPAGNLAFTTTGTFKQGDIIGNTSGTWNQVNQAKK